MPLLPPPAAIGVAACRRRCVPAVGAMLQRAGPIVSARSVTTRAAYASRTLFPVPQSKLLLPTASTVGPFLRSALAAPAAVATAARGGRALSGAVVRKPRAMVHALNVTDNKGAKKK
ncbi:hypothetical protein HK405_006580, partial [Cladochytrium tenue]